MSDAFSHVDLPRLGRRVLRLGVAGNFGLQTPDIHHAAERGVGFWLWTPRFRAVTPALREILGRDREGHVVATLNMVVTAGMVRRGVERALRELGTDYLDVFLLGWFGRTSFLAGGVPGTLLALKDEGKIRAVGTSIHDRPRAGRLARDSILDAFMLRYNARDPGAEEDVFPHLGARKPLVIAYTATSWGQLLRSTRGIEMSPWPGSSRPGPVPPLTAGLCYRFCLTSPHVHVALTGPKDRAQLDENLDALEAGPLSAEEEAWVREYGRQVKARRKIPYV
jgi:aryl-alcohol dehydrogenase-like predicted oxidoreductase